MADVTPGTIVRADRQVIGTVQVIYTASARPPFKTFPETAAYRTGAASQRIEFELRGKGDEPIDLNGAQSVTFRVIDRRGDIVIPEQPMSIIVPANGRVAVAPDNPLYQPGVGATLAALQDEEDEVQAYFIIITVTLLSGAVFEVPSIGEVPLILRSSASGQRGLTRDLPHA